MDLFHTIIHTLLHTFLDLINLIPFLFLSFLIMEYLEHGVKKKHNILENKKLGPFFGSLLGIIPQCGFSLLATNLYSVRVITIGTLLSIYLSTSDEMLPLLISNGISLASIIYILLTKVIVGIICGYLLDFVFRKRNIKEKDFSLCDEDNCHCESGILKSSIIHTFKIGFYIFLTTFILNIVIGLLGEEAIGRIFLKGSFAGLSLSSLVGLIPNCASSVILTELYVSGIISSGMLIGGLLTGSGIGLLVLFKVNHSKKENFLMLGLLYTIGVIVGSFIDFFRIVF